jgi:hypothetical protein
LSKGIDYINKYYPEAQPSSKDVSHLLYLIQKYEKNQKDNDEKIEEEKETKSPQITNVEKPL